MIYSFKIMDDQLRCTGRHFGYTGNTNTYFCEFDIQTDIDGLLWFCVFQQKGESIVRPIENNRCEVPEEVLIDAVPFNVGCFGTNVNDVKRVSTNFVRIDLEKGAYSEGNAPSVPTPDVWEVLLRKHLPVIGENSNWYLYDITTGEYRDSGVKALGKTGKSVYEVAVDNGFKGTEKEWLESLKASKWTVLCDTDPTAESTNMLVSTWDIDTDNFTELMIQLYVPKDSDTTVRAFQVALIEDEDKIPTYFQDANTGVLFVSVGGGVGNAVPSMNTTYLFESRFFDNGRLIKTEYSHSYGGSHGYPQHDWAAVGIYTKAENPTTCCSIKGKRGIAIKYNTNTLIFPAGTVLRVYGR